MVNTSEALAKYVAETSIEHFDAKTVAHAKMGILDTLAVTLAATRHPAAAHLLKYVHSTASAGRSTVLASPTPRSAEHAALANGSLAHLLDYDDASHSSSHCLPTALALVEQKGGSGSDLVRSYVVGREVRMHLNLAFDTGRAGGGGPGGRGWHSTGVVGSLASAAAGASALALDEHASRMAIGIASSLACGVNSNWGTMTKSLHAGSAARNGVLAAALAASGFTSSPDALTDRGGLEDALSCAERLDFGSGASDLTAYSYLGRHGPQAKRYPCCFASHGYIEAVQRFLAANDVAWDNVEFIETTRNSSLRYEFPFNDLECKFSAAFLIAATLITGSVTLDNCTAEFLATAPVQTLLGRTRYIETGDLGQRIRVVLTDGRAHDLPVLKVERPPVLSHIEQKFLDCTRDTLAPDEAMEVIDLVADLDRLHDLTQLTTLLSTHAAI